MHINDLPEDILEEILSYLSIKEKFRCEIVCRLWQQHVFTSVKSLGIEKVPNVRRDDNIFLGQHKHVIGHGNRLYHLPNEEETVKSIISKCGKNLRILRGYVNRSMVMTISRHCKKLHCIDLHSDSLEALLILGDTFGHQLTCVTIYDNLREVIKPFLHLCSQLTSFAFKYTRRHPALEIYSNFQWPAMELFDLSVEIATLPKQMASLKHLVLKDAIGGIQDITLQRLVLLKNLEVVSIIITHDVNKSSQWERVMSGWSGLQRLALEVRHDWCAHIEPSPPKLEYLSLVCRALSHSSCECKKSITFSTKLPKLKTLKVYVHELSSEHLSSIFDGIICCCPNLEYLSLGTDYRSRHLRVTMDTKLAPLLSLTFLKRLCLGEEFEITDIFASQLLKTLVHLTSFGERAKRVGTPVYDYLLPCGSLFWKALTEKASAFPTRQFELIGKAKGTVHLEEQIPFNVFLHLRFSATIRLTNNFGKNKNWFDLMSRCGDLDYLTLEIKENDLQLIGMSCHIKNLTIRCLNNADVQVDTALTFCPTLQNQMYLPNLTFVKIYQQHMSNEQLGVTLKCITELCLNLSNICLDRNNSVHEPIDEQLVWVYNCQSLQSLCFSQKFIISDKCGAKLINDIDSLYMLGCCRGQSLGFQFGSLVLNALMAKVMQGARIIVDGGPSTQEAEEIVKPRKIPDSLEFY